MLSYINRKEDLWYIFIPLGFNKTLAEMSDEERDNKRTVDKSTNALEEFAKWYENNDKMQKNDKKRGVRQNSTN